MTQSKKDKTLWFITIPKGETKHAIVHTDNWKEDFAYNSTAKYPFSRSRGYESKEELIAGERVLPDPCTYCGDLVCASSINPDCEKLNICSLCEFWYRKQKIMNDPKVVRIKGTHYYIGTEAKSHPSEMRGFGGRDFYIHFFDGRKVKTTNLWHNGQIPEHFSTILPDNAIFVKKEEFGVV